jgi:hypothetical protein
MQTKRISRVEIKDAAKGEVSAVFSTFGVIDADGDVTEPDAIEPGAVVPVSSYMHTSWQGALPVGVAKIRTTGDEAILDAQFFLGTSHGADTFETVKELADKGLGEWSYGFDIVDSDRAERDGKQVQVLKRLKIHEVSPVLVGAGVNTRTLSAKAASPETPRAKRAIASHETEVTTRSWDAAGVETAIPADARPSDLRSVYAWVDPDGDPEAKSSYKFPHHHGVGGPANVRALLAGIAALNGARGGASIPDADRKATYEHLASHLRDADREPPELRDRGTGPTKFSDELLEGLAGVSGLVDSASRVVALRASKGKSLSKVNTEFLDWIGDDLKRLQHLLTHPIDTGEGPSDDEIASVVLAAVARVNDL